MQKTTKYGVFGKITAVFLAMLVTLSCMMPLSHISDVSATNLLTSGTGLSLTADGDVSAVIAQPTVSESVLSSITTDDTDKQSKELSEGANDHIDYTVNSSFGDNILGVKATYYDYLSDEEIKAGGSWLNPLQAGTERFNGSEDNWYPFYGFNQRISNVAKTDANRNTWKYPLYFGNFCNTNDAYANQNWQRNSNGGWANVTNDTNAFNFNYLANNSTPLQKTSASVQGLVYPELIDNNLMVTSTQRAPYFDNNWLHQQEIGKVIQGEFPFRITEHTASNGHEYSEYTFSSANAKDNIYFTWAKDRNGQTYPTTVNYAKGTSYGGTYPGIDDGYKYFMYQKGSNKGIFPFNNCYGTAGNKNSNEKLNYGFGIRMDIEFRVPKGGVIPGTQTPIEFKFAGDDDLWVFITDNKTGESQLVLDMGGAHKESKGSIDFSNKIAKVEEAYDLSQPTTTVTRGTRYVYLSKDNINWGNHYAYFYDGDKAVGNNWPGYQMSSYDNSNNVRVAIPNGAKRVIFNNGAGAQTSNAGIDLASTSGAYWLDGSYNVNQWQNTPSDAGLGGSVNTGMQENVQKAFEFDNSDDKKTYTMTVFYMERGLIESNMEISFTMTPLTNDLTVEKQVDTTSVNPGLVDVLKDNEEFTYTAYNSPKTSGSATNLATNKVYNTDKSTGSTGTFTLQDKGTAYFDDQFETGSKMKFVERNTSNAGLSYSTSWQLTDNTISDTANSIIKSGDKTGTAVFDMINKAKNESARTSLNLKYVNTPVVAPLEVSKAVVDENNTDISSTTNTEFEYQILLDLREGNEYDGTFDLSYKLYDSNDTPVKSDDTLVDSDPAVDGVFTLKAGQYAIFEGMPVGANYKIVEKPTVGYTLQGATQNGAAITTLDNTVSAGISSGQNTVAFTNKYVPGTAVLKANKTLSGEKYTGNDFTFNVSGMASKYVNGTTTVDTSSVSLDVNTATNGVVTFENTDTATPFTYEQVGTYCYKITEIAGSNTDYIYDTTAFYAQVVVTLDSDGNLKADPVYYSDETFSTVISADDVLFENDYASCTVRVYKTDSNKVSLKDGEFKLVSAVIKKDAFGKEYWDEDESENALSFDPVAVTKHADGEYYAEFTDVPQGDYVVIETRAPEGYELSTRKEYVEVKRDTSNNGIIKVPFSDVDTFLLPKAGGNGNSNVYVYAGMVSIGLAFIFFSIGRKANTAKKGCR